MTRNFVIFRNLPSSEKVYALENLQIVTSRKYAWHFQRCSIAKSYARNKDTFKSRKTWRKPFVKAARPRIICLVPDLFERLYSMKILWCGWHRKTAKLKCPQKWILSSTLELKCPKIRKFHSNSKIAHIFKILPSPHEMKMSRNTEFATQPRN